MLGCKVAALVLRQAFAPPGDPPLFRRFPAAKLSLSDCRSQLTSEGNNLEKVTLLKEKLHACLSTLSSPQTEQRRLEKKIKKTSEINSSDFNAPESFEHLLTIHEFVHFFQMRKH